MFQEQKYTIWSCMNKHIVFFFLAHLYSTSGQFGRNTSLFYKLLETDIFMEPNFWMAQTFNLSLQPCVCSKINWDIYRMSTK